MKTFTLLLSLFVRVTFVVCFSKTAGNNTYGHEDQKYLEHSGNGRSLLLLYSLAFKKITAIFWVLILTLKSLIIHNITASQIFSTKFPCVLCSCLCGTNQSVVVTPEPPGSSPKPPIVDPTVPEECLIPNQLVILVDSSGSIRPPEFEISQTFTSRLALAFNAETTSEVSVILFSSFTKVLFSFLESNNVTPKEIEERITTATQLGGQTWTHLALENALNQFKLQPRDVPKKVVIITDGGSTFPDLTEDAAMKFRKANINTFAIGVGDKVNIDELMSITGNIPEHLFNSSGFDDLLKLLLPVSQTVCAK